MNLYLQRSILFLFLIAIMIACTNDEQELITNAISDKSAQLETDN